MYFVKVLLTQKYRRIIQFIKIISLSFPLNLVCHFNVCLKVGAQGLEGFGSFEWRRMNIV
ncbi:MAG: hypothetical protein ACI93R_003732 [Flavobacteriales bacterium]|jgi:hypothetical protein